MLADERAWLRLHVQMTSHDSETSSSFPAEGGLDGEVSRRGELRGDSAQQAHHNNGGVGGGGRATAAVRDIGSEVSAVGISVAILAAFCLAFYLTV